MESSQGGEIISFDEKVGMNLIVIGAIGRTGRNKFLFGRVIQKTVKNPKITGLIVPLIDSEVT
ncbi:MAG: universal stress protein [Methanotrichaceae archaeon]